MEDDKKIMEFLQGYAEILKVDVDISEGLPLTMRAIMGAGCVVLEGANGKHIATISVEDDFTRPSIPVGPVTMTFARLFVNLINKWGEIQKTAHREQTNGSDIR